MTEPRPQFWLLKSEPDAYSIDDLEHEVRTPWDGVRNFSARNRMRSMEIGDLALFYHSSTKPTAVVGLCRVCKAAYPDPSQFDSSSKYYDAKSTAEAPRWSMVDVEYVAHLPQPVTLAEIKAEPTLAEMMLVRRGRLSVQEVTAEEFETIVAMGGGRMPRGSAKSAKKVAKKKTAKKKTAKKKTAKKKLAKKKLAKKKTSTSKSSR